MAFENLTQADLDSMKINPVTQAAPTAEEVQRSYNAAMDSVNLLNAGKPEDMTDEDWADTVKRNKDHLQIQLDKGDYYAGYDLTPFEQAVA
jgi:collagenase-like PrtC family protease